MRRCLCWSLVAVSAFALAGCVLAMPPESSGTPRPSETSTTTATPAPELVSPRWQDTLKQMAALTRDLAIPDHLLQEDAARTGEEFDVNEYFTVLTHLSPEPGYVLDYVYYHDSLGGEPIIYARREGESPYATALDYREARGDPFGESRREYLEHIVVDGTAEGFFELVVLAIQGEQFYLDWHANYNDLTVLNSREMAEAVIEANGLTAEQEGEALQIDFQPRVEFDHGTARVRTVLFTKWGGFFEKVCTISRDFPHQMLECETEELVPYRCGIVF